MPVNPDPYNPQFPVDFTPDGDTTSMGMFKHIQEILRIYSLLNGLEMSKMDAEEFQKWAEDVFNVHVDAADPHPNLVIDIDNFSGQVPASRVGTTGDAILTNATIDRTHVNNFAHTHTAEDLPALPALPVSSTTQKGIIETATNAEAATGTDTERSVTPAHLAALKSAIMDAVESACGAYYGCSSYTAPTPCSCDNEGGCRDDCADIPAV
jgi:hypothetical protein